MDATARRIEIFAPFTAAFDYTKLVLFQPFDLTKWLTIGFAAFLAGLADGTRLNFSGGWSGPDFKGKWFSADSTGVAEQFASPLFVALMVAIGIVVLVVILLFMWLGARGRFMFIDCVVRNRGAIEEPWREYRREGNGLFLLMLVAGVIWLLLFALLALPLLIPFFQGGEFSFGIWQIVYLLTAVPVVIVLSVIWMLIAWFIAPVMYRQRCSALAALRQVVNLIGEYPVPFILYLLFAVVLLVAGGLTTCLVSCVTCCIALLPYIGTVILLPLYTFYYSYTLLFLRQFGPEYDAWTGLLPLEQGTPAMEQTVEQEPPPVEENPPPSDEPPPLP
ncbi:hypothetical protein BH20VER2_BH20VER2_16790 [soil metagenome]